MKKKNTFYFFIMFLFFSCTGQNKKEIELQVMLDKFDKQEHRFEFRGMHLYYNEKRIELDKSLEYYEDIFGKNYSLEKSDRIVKYNNIPISLNKGFDTIVGSITIEYFYYNQKTLNNKEMGYDYGYPPSILNNSYLLIDGVPINKNTDNLEWFNEQLRIRDKEEFIRGIAGSNSVHRQDLTIEEGYGYGIYIYIYI